MRQVPDFELSPWGPPVCVVDADGKVVGGAPGPINNWGRWGQFDQGGTTNLLTAERAAEASTLVRRIEQVGLNNGFVAMPATFTPGAPLPRDEAVVRDVERVLASL